MGNEFLRHFWASYGSNVKEKIEKNKRMADQLKITLGKIRKLSEIQLDDDDLQKFQQFQSNLNLNINSVVNSVAIFISHYHSFIFFDEFLILTRNFFFPSSLVRC